MILFQNLFKFRLFLPHFEIIFLLTVEAEVEDVVFWVPTTVTRLEIPFSSSPASSNDLARGGSGDPRPNR